MMKLVTCARWFENEIDASWELFAGRLSFNIYIKYFFTKLTKKDERGIWY